MYFFNPQDGGRRARSPTRVAGLFRQAKHPVGAESQPDDVTLARQAEGELSPGRGRSEGSGHRPRSPQGLPPWRGRPARADQDLEKRTRNVHGVQDMEMCFTLPTRRRRRRVNSGREAPHSRQAPPAPEEESRDRGGHQGHRGGVEIGTVISNAAPTARASKIIPAIESRSDVCSSCSLSNFTDEAGDMRQRDRQRRRRVVRGTWRRKPAPGPGGPREPVREQHRDQEGEQHLPRAGHAQVAEESIRSRSAARLCSRVDSPAGLNRYQGRRSDVVDLEGRVLDTILAQGAPRPPSGARRRRRRARPARARRVRGIPR